MAVPVGGPGFTSAAAACPSFFWINTSMVGSVPETVSRFSVIVAACQAIIMLVSAPVPEVVTVVMPSRTISRVLIWPILLFHREGVLAGLVPASLGRARFGRALENPALALRE